MPWKDLDAYGEPDAPVRGRSAPPSGTLAYAYREGSSQVSVPGGRLFQVRAAAGEPSWPAASAPAVAPAAGRDSHTW